MTINVSDLLTNNTTVSQDPSPTLSGNLDVNGHSIIDLTGPVNIDGFYYPTIDGPNGAIIYTDGSGNLSLSTEPPIYQSEKASPFGVATLNSSGKIPDSQIPALALTDVFVVSSEAQMLALLSAQHGDVAIRTDVNVTYILSGSDPTQISDWQELLDRPDLITSVFGRTGAIAATSGDYTATQITYSNASSGLTATNAQAAIDEIENISSSAIQPGDNITTLTNNAGYISDINSESIGDLSDVDITGIISGQVILWNGTSFVDHTLVKSDISDFSDADYATASQGSLADTATQPGDNISTLTNDANYISNISSESIGDLSDVDITGIASNELLQWNGTTFISVAPTSVGSVTSVFGRTGIVSSQSGDYTATQITYSNISSGLTATNVQTAIDETEGRIDTIEGSYIPSTEKGAINGVATLNSSGVIPNSQLPPLAITDTFVVNSQSAMLMLSSAQTGDIAVRTDENKSYILSGNDYSNIADWQELLTPVDSVLSVNGQTGAVVLDKSDVGLGNVDNTSDLNKPISNATQTALNDKADKIVPVTVGNLASLDASGNLTDSGILSGDVVESGDNISVLNNDVGYVTAATAPIQTVNGQTGTVVLDADDIDDTSTTNKFTNSANLIKLSGIETGAELNTASNLGAGEGVYSQKVGSDLQFKSLLLGPTMIVSSTPTEITISPDPIIFSAHNGAVTQTISFGSFVTALFGSSYIMNANFTYNAGIVTVGTSGIYQIAFEITITSGAANTTAFLNGSEILGSHAHVSLQGSQDPQTGSSNFSMNLTSGDELTVNIESVDGTVNTMENSCRFNLRKLS